MLGPLREWLFGGEGVAEDAESGDLYFHGVAGLHWAYAGGGSGGDEVAGFEGDGCADIAEEEVEGKDEVRGGALLFDLAVEAGGDGDGVAVEGVDLVGDDGADGAEGVPAFAAGPLAVGLLDVA